MLCVKALFLYFLVPQDDWQQESTSDEGMRSTEYKVINKIVTQTLSAVT